MVDAPSQKGWDVGQIYRVTKATPCLREWIRRDVTLTPEQKSGLERFVVHESLDWQICNQIANQQKQVDARPRYKGATGSGGFNP